MREAVLRLLGPAFTVEQQPGAYVQRLEAACHLLHRGIGQATGAQPSSSGPAAHKAASAAASPAPSAPGSISAGELCTLLLTDQEVLDVVLALHDIRAAQLCHLLSWPGLHALKLPPPSAALAQQLSQSQWSVPGSQLLSFVSALERDHDNSLKGDPLLRAYVQRLEAACNLLHRGIEQATGAQTASSRLTPLAMGAQPSSSCPSTHIATSAAASPTPSATGSTAVVELCTLLLTDREVLDVVLALHDIRAAQLCHLLSWPGSHALKLPPPSAALAKQLSQSQWSVPGSQLLAFVSALERDHNNSLQDNPLLRVWDSMHRAMLLPSKEDLALDRLHSTLPGLLLGLTTAVTVNQAAGHPEAQAQRSQFVSCLLHLGPLVIFNVYGHHITYFGQDVLAWLQDKVTTSCPDQLARLLASSPVVTGWPGALPAKPSPMDSSTAQDRRHVQGSSAPGPANLAALNVYAHLAQALCAMLGRQEEELGITCQAE
ncbi:hypothetical protein HaLaN_16924, partial [Haematococcus lacustris]